MRRVLYCSRLQQSLRFNFLLKPAKLQGLETKFSKEEKEPESSPDSFGQYYKRGHNTRHVP